MCKSKNYVIETLYANRKIEFEKEKLYEKQKFYMRNRKIKYKKRIMRKIEKLSAKK